MNFILVLLLLSLVSQCCVGVLHVKDYNAVHAARLAAEEEARQHRVDGVVEKALASRCVCEEGETQISFESVEEATPERIGETVRRLNKRGWNASLVKVNLSGTWQVAAQHWLAQHADGHPTLASCLCNALHVTRPGLVFACHRRSKCSDEPCFSNDVTVLRLSLASHLGCDDDDDGEPVRYQCDRREERVEKERQIRTKSDRFLWRFFDEGRVLPSGDTIISLLGWPASLGVAKASVEAMAAQGWPVAMENLCVVEEVHPEQFTPRLCTSSNVKPDTLFITYTRGLSHWTYDHDSHIHLVGPFNEEFREELIYRCQTGYDLWMDYVLGENRSTCIDVIRVSMT